MVNNKSSHKPVILAAITASVMMLVFGLTYRILQAQLMIPASKFPIDPSVLEEIPMQIGSWVGVTASIDDDVADRTNADALISRQYTNSDTSESVSLYIACGIKTSEIMAHHPMVCYPGNGWTFVDRCSTELPLNNSMKLPCNIFQFSRGKLEKEKATVLHYLIVDGSYLRDVSLAQTGLWRLTSKAYYVAQVHITSISRNARTTDSAKRKVIKFAEDSASTIDELFERIHKDQVAQSTVAMEKGDSLQ